jgi:hypothetical protein
MNATKFGDKEENKWISAFLSKTLAIFYSVLVIITTLVIIFVK